jgi:hypothetical protein
MNDPTGADTPLLLDRVLDDFQFTRLESVVVDGDPRTVYEVARGIDLMDIHSPLFDMVTRARGIADRVRHRTHPEPASMRVADLFDADAAPSDQPWVGLAEDPGREMVFGAIGKVWKPSVEWRPVQAQDFPGFDEPGWAKIAANLVVHAYGTHRSLLSYEARTACTDTETTRKFARYWTVVSPGAGLVLRTALRAIKATAEREAPVAA